MEYVKDPEMNTHNIIPDPAIIDEEITFKQKLAAFSINARVGIAFPR